MVSSPDDLFDEDGAGSGQGGVPAEYRDMASMTAPGSLQRIMK
jgi:hypothetical protein